jgi:MYXO-CTERM domain-containing protein
LTSDDVAGICNAYPPDRQASTNECGPGNGFASDCGPGDGERCATSESGCCSTAPGRPDPLGLLAFSAVAAAAALARARRKKRG